MIARYCTNQHCPRCHTCRLHNPPGNPEDTFVFGDWYVAGYDERCMNYAPAEADGNSESLIPMIAGAAWVVALFGLIYWDAIAGAVASAITGAGLIAYAIYEYRSGKR